MVKKWGITAAPNDKNPGRQKLLIKGEMNDIFLIVKTLRGVCSRPEKISGDFNFAIYLTELAPATVAKLKGVMGELNLVPAEVKPEIAGRNVVESIEPFEAPRQKLELPPDTRPAPAESKPPVRTEPEQSFKKPDLEPQTGRAPDKISPSTETQNQKTVPAAAEDQPVEDGLLITYLFWNMFALKAASLANARLFTPS